MTRWKEPPSQTRSAQRKMTILMITGSRAVCDDCTQKCVHETLTNIHASDTVHTLLSGHARGVDRLAEDWAATRAITIRHCLSDWKQYGRAAELMRNKSMIDEATSVVAFWDGTSKGTKRAIDLASRHNKLIKVVRL